MVGHVLLRRTFCTSRFAEALLTPSWTRRLFSSSTGIGSVAEIGDNVSNVRDGKQYPSYKSRTWSVSELDTLSKLVQESATEFNMARTLGRSLHSVRGMRKNMARHSLEFLKARAERFLRGGVSRPWSPDETLRMQELFAQGHSIKDVSIQLDRSRRSVEQKYNTVRSVKYKQESGTWSHEDVRLLEALRAQGLTMANIASRLNRSWDSVRQKLYRLDNPLRQPLRGKPFTPAEDAKILELRQQGMRWDEVQARLPDRISSSLRSRYSHLTAPKALRGQGPRLWTSQEVSLLHDLWARKISIKEVAAKLERSIRSVEIKAYSERLTTGSLQQKWDSKSVNTLLEMRTRGRPFADIATTLGRTDAAVRAAFDRYSRRSKSAESCDTTDALEAPEAVKKKRSRPITKLRNQ